MSVLVCVAAALYAGLGLRIAVETAENELDFVLDFVELGVCLMIVSLSANRKEPRSARTSSASTEAVKIRPVPMLATCLRCCDVCWE